MLMYLHGEYVMSFELSILNLKTYLINLNLKNYFFAQTIVSHGRMGRGAWGGHVPPPPKFYGRAKITARFGQNLKDF